MSSSPRIVYQQGDHVCTLFTTPEEQLQAAVEYISGGLSRGERCLYICGEHEIPEFREALKKAGINVDSEEQRGALVLLNKHEAHLKGGSFDPDTMISTLGAAVENALAAGFAGLCAAGDMSWLLDEAPGSERVAEYEARLNQFYKTHRALGLCQYNRNKLPDEAWITVLLRILTFAWRVESCWRTRSTSLRSRRRIARHVRMTAAERFARSRRDALALKVNR